MTHILLQTNRGSVRIALEDDLTPKTVANFLQYVHNGFFENTLFHRVIPGFMVQGGGLTPDMSAKKTLNPVENEAHLGLKNTTGTIAMARTSDPHSATSQFFINVADNAFLDHRAQTAQGWGYCAFGRVVEGMDVVHALAQVATTSKAGHQDVPQNPILIEAVSIVETAPREATLA